MRRHFLFLAAGLIAAGLVQPALAVDDAVDCENAMSTAEMNFCAGEDLERADKELNAVYQKALKAIPGLAVEDMPQFNAASWEKALRESQRAWVAFRDAECETHAAMFWGGGTGGTVVVLGCKTEKTKERTKELKERYNFE